VRVHPRPVHRADIRWRGGTRADTLRFRLGEEVAMMCMVPSEVAATATTSEFAVL
jgi:hypothetical protein